MKFHSEDSEIALKKEKKSITAPSLEISTTNIEIVHFTYYQELN